MVASGNIGPGVKAQCKTCGNYYPAEQFKLHYALKQMVCPACYTGKSQSKGLKNEVQKEEVQAPPKPAGWDKDDEYLERITRMRKDSVKGIFVRIPGSDLLKCSCPRCAYSYKYDHYRHTPTTCPYCNAPVPKFRPNDL
ncbi:hypothetical protein HYX11_01620 [Candidatus Woesearchaeota archaeon]|nr:hypothetical protein [Candidatus Woesearchaeota archaeon]